MHLPYANRELLPAWRGITVFAAIMVGLGIGRLDLEPAPQTAILPPALTHGCAAPARQTTAHTRRSQFGIASFYARRFGGRIMADGTPMQLHGNNAASKTLPLGTIARVTNLETGKSAIVAIRDRGPYVRGRIVDLSPATARKIGLTRREGLTAVEVAPISVPAASARRHSSRERLIRTSDKGQRAHIG
ncbi:MAG: septal ring lytic transglycosylase RlpA family protein [Steroidobacteraceae bacterium]